MAAIWGMEKFYFYLYSKEFLLQMDQKPLTSIFKKHLVDVSPRVWRIAMRSWPYMFKMEWILGKDNAIADGLSRVSPMPVNLIKSEIELHIHQVNIIKATIEGEDIRKLQQGTASDLELQAVAKAISNGWPTLHKQTHRFQTGITFFIHKQELNILIMTSGNRLSSTWQQTMRPILHGYWIYRDELSIDNGILTKNSPVTG